MPTQALVRRLPPALAEVARRPLPRDPPLRGRARRALLRVLREGGVPAHVRVFALVDNPQLRFVAADSLVLSQLYWYGEQGWEPELLPWWRHCCRHAGGVLELGANVGYFTVQGGSAAPSTRYLAVEPHPVSWRICRDNLALNRVTSVQLLAAAAVTDPTISTVSLHVPADQFAAPTVVLLTDGGELPPKMARDVRTRLEVPAVDVRELLDGVDLLKLDVEGQEHACVGRRPTPRPSRATGRRAPCPRSERRCGGSRTASARDDPPFRTRRRRLPAVSTAPRRATGATCRRSRRTCGRPRRRPAGRS